MSAIEEERGTMAPPRPLCDNCGRPNYLGRPLMKLNHPVRVCIDCFAFITGSDPRDPAHERTARSGDPAYMLQSEWREAGEPCIPVERSMMVSDSMQVSEDGWRKPQDWPSWTMVALFFAMIAVALALAYLIVILPER